MKKVLMSLIFLPFFFFGQNEFKQHLWTSSEIKKCKKDFLVDLEFDDERLQLLFFSGNSKESFAECACDSLKKLYPSYVLANSNLTSIDEFQAKIISLPCLLKFDLTDDCISGNCFNGYGKLVFANKESYEGYFKMALFEGKGTYLYKNGDKYVGEHKENRKQGIGSFFFFNGGSYTGEWQNNMFHGLGLRTWTNGETYYGYWKDGYKYGNGTYTYKNGAVHTGRYENDLPHGPGKFIYSGSKLIGNWVRGKKHGKFVFRNAGEKDKKEKYFYGEEVK